MRHAVGQLGARRPRLKIGEGLVGYAVLHKTPVVVDDVAADPRYIRSWTTCSRNS